MSIAPTFNDAEPSPIEIDPRDCELNDGPCPTCGKMQIADQELHEWTNRWVKRAEDRRSVILDRPALAQAYHTAQSTIDAFWFVVRNHDDAYLAAWLDRHSMDAAFLLRLWDTKNGKS